MFGGWVPFALTTKPRSHWVLCRWCLWQPCLPQIPTKCQHLWMWYFHIIIKCNPSCVLGPFCDGNLVCALSELHSFQHLLEVELHVIVLCVFSLSIMCWRDSAMVRACQNLLPLYDWDSIPLSVFTTYCSPMCWWIFFTVMNNILINICIPVCLF